MGRQSSPKAWGNPLLSERAAWTTPKTGGKAPTKIPEMPDGSSSFRVGKFEAF